MTGRPKKLPPPTLTYEVMEDIDQAKIDLAFNILFEEILKQEGSGRPMPVDMCVDSYEQLGI